MRNKTILQCAHVEEGACAPCRNPMAVFKRDDAPVFRSARLRNVAKVYGKTPLQLRQAMKANEDNRTGRSQPARPSALLAIAEHRIDKMIYA
jgi:hypothetical protein